MLANESALFAQFGFIRPPELPNLRFPKVLSSGTCKGYRDTAESRPGIMPELSDDSVLNLRLILVPPLSERLLLIFILHIFKASSLALERHLSGLHWCFDVLSPPVLGSRFYPSLVTSRES